MYNLLIAIGSAIVAFFLGFLAAGWIAGFVPALLALVVVYALLARRTGRQVEAIFAKVIEPMQAGRMDEVRAILQSALPLGKWQFLVAEQVNSQLGQLDYMEGVGLKMGRQITASNERLARARPLLEKAWSRDWRAKATLALIHHREHRVEEALSCLKGVESSGKSETLYWAVYAWILNEAKRRDEALQVLGKGLKELPKSKGLLALQEALSNRKRPPMAELGEAWYAFVPEDIPQEKREEMARARMGQRSPKTFPMPRR